VGGSAEHFKLYKLKTQKKTGELMEKTVPQEGTRFGRKDRGGNGNRQMCKEGKILPKNKIARERA